MCFYSPVPHQIPWLLGLILGSLAGYFPNRWWSQLLEKSLVTIYPVPYYILAFVLLIAAYTWNELRVNSFIKDNDRVFILQSKWKREGMGLDFTTLGPMAKAMRSEYPSLVQDYYRWDGILSIISKGDKYFRENLQVGDSTFLTMFNMPMAHGNARTALNGPDDVVILYQ